MARALELLDRNINAALNYAIEQFREELRQQGHRSSGRLEESFAKVIEIRFSGVVKGEIKAEEYGIYLDRGVPADRVNYNPKVLLPWIRRIRPGLSIREQISFAYAIRGKQRKTGTPTPGSFSFTKNGRRKNWVKAGIMNKQKRMNELINLAAFLQLLVEEELTGFRNAA